MSSRPAEARGHPLEIHARQRPVVDFGNGLFAWLHQGLGGDSSLDAVEEPIELGHQLSLSETQLVKRRLTIGDRYEHAA